MLGCVRYETTYPRDASGLEFERPVAPRLISERILVEEFADGSLATGEPLAPVRFRWRDRVVDVAEVVDTWRKMTGDGYVRRHYFHLQAADGTRYIVYCERQARKASRPTQRWFLYTME